MVYLSFKSIISNNGNACNSYKIKGFNLSRLDLNSLIPSLKFCKEIPKNKTVIAKDLTACQFTRNVVF